MPFDALLPIAFVLGYFAWLDPVRAGAHKTGGHAGFALDRFRQYRHHQCAAHRTQGPRRRDIDRRHAQGHHRGHHSRLFRAALTPRCWPHSARFLGHLFPGVAQVSRRQRRRGLYRRAAGGCLWPAALLFCLIWLAVAVITRYSSLSALIASLVMPVLLWWFGQLALAALFAVLTLAGVLRAPRKHQTAAGGDRKQDRAEVNYSHSGAMRSIEPGIWEDEQLWIPGPREGACPGMDASIFPPARPQQTLPPSARRRRCRTARSPARRPAIHPRRRKRER